MNITSEKGMLSPEEFSKQCVGIYPLSEVDSLQIALQGYIQLDDKLWYMHARGIFPDFNTSHESCRNKQFKIVSNHTATRYYLLSTDQRSALRMNK